MLFRILVPLVLLFILLPIVVHWPVFERYTASGRKEVAAVLACAVLYFAVWNVVELLLESFAPVSLAWVIASAVALATLPLSLGLGFKIFGVPKSSRFPGGVH